MSEGLGQGPPCCYCGSSTRPKEKSDFARGEKLSKGFTDQIRYYICNNCGKTCCEV